jgi:hypothetical protein
MNQPIEPTYITFEQSKLLKEKGIEIPTDECLFFVDDINNDEEHQIKNRDDVFDGGIGYIVDENEYRVYHQWELVEWLRVNHGIWISVSLNLSNTQLFDFEIQKKQWLMPSEEHYDTPQAAYSAAFDYVLKNLI